MKSTILTIFAAMALFISSFGQDTSGETPAEVTAAFDTKFSSAIKTKWEKVDEGYKVKFEQRSEEKWALFNAEGKCLQHNTVVKSLRLPGGVVSSIKRQFPDYRIRYVEKVKLADNNTLYEVEIEKEKKKNRDAYFLQLSSRGRIIKNEPIDVEAKR